MSGPMIVGEQAARGPGQLEMLESQLQEIQYRLQNETNRLRELMRGFLGSAPTAINDKPAKTLNEHQPANARPMIHRLSSLIEDLHCQISDLQVEINRVEEL